MMQNTRLRFRKKNKVRNLLFVVICVALIFMFSGMALIESKVDITGSAKIGKIEWDVHFENLVVASLKNAEGIIEDGTKISLAMELGKPDDVYTFMVDVTNGGTIDASLESFEVTLPEKLSEYMDYSFTYSDESEIKIGDELPSGESKSLKFILKFKDDQDLTELFSNEDNYEFDLLLDMSYVQKGSN